MKSNSKSHSLLLYCLFFPLTNHLKEIRKGIESSNATIIRLGQALQDLVSPPIQVKATNAFFAHNQQINQQMPPSDLENVSTSARYAKAHS